MSQSNGRKIPGPTQCILNLKRLRYNLHLHTPMHRGCRYQQMELRCLQMLPKCQQMTLRCQEAPFSCRRMLFRCQLSALKCQVTAGMTGTPCHQYAKHLSTTCRSLLLLRRQTGRVCPCISTAGQTTGLLHKQKPRLNLLAYSQHHRLAVYTITICTKLKHLAGLKQKLLRNLGPPGISMHRSSKMRHLISPVKMSGCVCHQIDNQLTTITSCTAWHVCNSETLLAVHLHAAKHKYLFFLRQVIRVA